MKEYSYWLDTVEQPREGEPASESSASTPAIPDSCDVAILGGGYTGLSAARHLARRGARVVVLERERVGWGASSRNGGQVLAGLKLDPAALVARFGERRAREMFDASIASISHMESVIAEDRIDCEFARTGHVLAAWKASHFDAFRTEQALLQRVFGHRVHLVPRAEQRSEIGSGAYHGLLVDEASGAINPAKYVRGLARSACAAGASILERVAVTAIEPAGSGHPCRVRTPIGTVEANDVLVATNGYTNGACPPLQRRLVPVGSFSIATEPLGSPRADAILPRRRVAFDSKNFLFYFRLTADGRLLFGGRAEFGRPDADTTRRAATILRAGMTQVFPELAAARIEYAWGGNVAFTRDQVPHAGVLGGLHYAAGYCGHGIAMATYLGDQAGRRLAGETITHPFVDDRFAAIPLYSGRPWFLPLVGAYYRVMDWLQ